MIRLRDLLFEAGGGTPSEQAKALGLVYGGFAQWVNPDTRKTMARTVDGKLVKVDGAEEGTSKADKGRLAILSFDASVLSPDRSGVAPDKIAMYNKLLIKILQFGGDFTVFSGHNQERDVAMYLKKVGVSAGVKIIPLAASTPQKKRVYVEKKIKEGYKQIQYFDNDSTSVNAIESLKAPYNKLSIQIETFDLPNLQGDQKSWADSE